MSNLLRNDTRESSNYFRKGKTLPEVVMISICYGTVVENFILLRIWSWRVRRRPFSECFFLSQRLFVVISEEHSTFHCLSNGKRCDNISFTIIVMSV